MKKLIDKTLQDIELHEKEIWRLKNFLKSLRAGCKHEKKVLVGNNHNDDIYECTECRQRFYY